MEAAAIAASEKLSNIPIVASKNGKTISDGRMDADGRTRTDGRGRTEGRTDGRTDGRTAISAAAAAAAGARRMGPRPRRRLQTLKKTKCGSNYSSGYEDQFYPKIIKIGAILEG